MPTWLDGLKGLARYQLLRASAKDHGLWVGGGRVWVEGECGWRENVGGGRVWVEGGCGWRASVEASRYIGVEHGNGEGMGGQG